MLNMRWVPILGAEWLSLTDAIIAGELPSILREEGAPSKAAAALRVLEIGVYKGAWSASVLANNQTVELWGVDPYPPGYEGAEKTLRWRMRKMRLESRYRHLSSIHNVEGRFELIHIDGNHGEKSFAEDLDAALMMLGESGILVVDDVRHPWFPGIAFNLYSRIATSKWCVLIDTGNKLYLCSESHHSDFLEIAKKRLNRLNLRVSSSLVERREGIKPEPQTVKSKELLFVRHGKPSFTALHKILSLATSKIRAG